MDIANNLRNDRLDAISAGVDAGSTGGLLKGYDGTQPSKGGTVTNILFTNVFATTSFPAASGAAVTSNALTPAAAVATATCTWYRVTDSTGAFCWDGPASELNLPTNSIVEFAEVDVATVTLTDPNG